MTKPRPRPSGALAAAIAAAAARDGVSPASAERPHKFGAVPTVIDGIRFDSKGEAQRWQELRLLESAGEIEGLERQVSYDLVVNGVRVARQVLDFRYREHGRLVVEDFKSPATKTAAYRLKTKMLAAIYGIVVRETYKGGVATPTAAGLGSARTKRNRRHPCQGRAGQQKEPI